MGFDPKAIIQLGDIGVWKETLHKFPRLPLTTYFILGNHEMLGAETIAEECLPSSYVLVKPDKPTNIYGLKTIGINGSHYIDDYNTPPGSTINDYDIEKALSLDRVDMILTHDCPYGIGVKSNFFTPGRYVDVGAKELYLLFDLKPSIWLFGHHHLNFTAIHNTIHLIGQTVACDGFGILDTETLGYRFVSWLVEEEKEMKSD